MKDSRNNPTLVTAFKPRLVAPFHFRTHNYNISIPSNTHNLNSPPYPNLSKRNPKTKRNNKKKKKQHGAKANFGPSSSARQFHRSFFGPRYYRSYSDGLRRDEHYLPSPRAGPHDTKLSFWSQDSNRYSGGREAESTTVFSNTLAGPGLAAMFTPPPSFPNNNIKPSFTNSTATNVTVIRGRMAELKCAVENLGTKSVSKNKGI